MGCQQAHEGGAKSAAISDSDIYLDGAEGEQSEKARRLVAGWTLWQREGRAGGAASGAQCVAADTSGTWGEGKG